MNAFFVERRRVQTWVLTRAGRVDSKTDEDAGFNLETKGVRRWVESEGHEVSRLPAGLRDAAGEILTRPVAEDVKAERAELTGWLQALPAQVDARLGGQLQVILQSMTQRILAGTGDLGQSDRRSSAVVELRVHLPGDRTGRSMQRELSFPDDAALHAGRARILEALRTLEGEVLTRTHHLPFPRGIQTVVMPPGADAGVFFHEVCGHPLEGDVAARGASFLARRRGQRVAPEWVTVVDDPGLAPEGVSYRFDDEGTLGAAACLIDRGIVGTPLTDVRSGASVGLGSNGHARCLGFRHAPIPRMCHTALLPKTEGVTEDLASILAQTETGVFISYLNPKHVSLASGAFAFYVMEAREIRAGKLGAYLEPGLLVGDGLSALAGLELVGRDSAVFNGIRGCGKLDQMGLAVSFAQPALRFAGLGLEPGT